MIVKHFFSNHQGSVLYTTRSATSGALHTSFHYGAYGESGDAPTGNPIRYTGRYLDAETGLYYYRARYYSAKLGRLLQTDPIGIKDDLNLYAYVYGDPLNRADPSGMCDMSCPAIDQDQKAFLAGKMTATEYGDRAKARGVGAATGAAVVALTTAAVASAPALASIGTVPSGVVAGETALSAAPASASMAAAAQTMAAQATAATSAALSVPTAVGVGEVGVAAAATNSAMSAALPNAAAAIGSATSQMATRTAAVAVLEGAADLSGMAATARGAQGAAQVAEMAKAGAIQQEARAAVQAAMEGARKGGQLLKECIQGGCF